MVVSGQENVYENLMVLEARNPAKLKKMLTEIPVPFSIMSGSWFSNGSMYGVWVMLDRPIRMVKKKDSGKPKVEVTEKTKTEVVKQPKNEV